MPALPAQGQAGGPTGLGRQAAAMGLRQWQQLATRFRWADGPGTHRVASARLQHVPFIRNFGSAAKPIELSVSSLSGAWASALPALLSSPIASGRPWRLSSETGRSDLPLVPGEPGVMTGLHVAGTALSVPCRAPKTLSLVPWPGSSRRQDHSIARLPASCWLLPCGR